MRAQESKNTQEKPDLSGHSTSQSAKKAEGGARKGSTVFQTLRHLRERAKPRVLNIHSHASILYLYLCFFSTEN